MLRLLILGDSAAAGVGVERQSQALAGQLIDQLDKKFRLKWRLIAQTGATTEDVLFWLDAMDRESFDVVVSSLGVNDITRGLSRGVWVCQQRELDKKISHKFGPLLKLNSAVPPMGSFIAVPQPLRWVLGLQADRFNIAARRLWLRTANSELVDPFSGWELSNLAPDGYHPGEQGYRAWAETIATVIATRLLPSFR